ncbi:phage head morphogenesis protein [Neisseria sp.]
MDGIEYNFAGLVDKAAFEHFKAKKILPGFSHYDVWLYQHSLAFTVAKMMDADMLAEVKDAIEAAQRNGTAFADFKKRLKPYLMAKGWWGEQIMTDPLDGEPKWVRLGSTRRLKTIFNTNMQTAFAAGQWQRIQANKKALPYLRYNHSAAGHPRDSHKRYYGLVLPVDHDIWKVIFPPNGYGCKCSVSALTRRQAEREGISGEPDVDMVEFTNPRTGKTVLIPDDITPSFAHNHGDRLGAVKALYADKYGKTALEKLEIDLDQYLTLRGKPDIFESSESIIAEGKKLFERYRNVIIDAREAGDPHKAIIEIMKSEGVELGVADVAGYSRDADMVAEVREALTVYPKKWVDAVNGKGKVFIATAEGRAYHVMPDIERDIDYNRFIRTRDERFAVFKEAFKHRMVKNGDSLLLVNIHHTMPPVERIATHIHEFAHRIQSNFPELDGYFQRLFKERTKKDKIKKLLEMNPNMDYDPSEKGKRDDFPNEYYGKMYGRNHDNPKADEMLTMTFQALLGGDIRDFDEIARKPDFLFFGLALLVRWKP